MKEDKQKIKAAIIFEIIGKPPEHLVSSLDSIISQLGAEQGIEVTNKDIKEPRKMEQRAGVANAASGKIENNEFYVSFAEVEIKAESIQSLIMVMFRYMPAHVEIISPESLPQTNLEWGNSLNEILRRLHAYDEVARVLQVEKAMLENKLKELEKRENKPRKDSKAKKAAAKKTKKE